MSNFIFFPKVILRYISFKFIFIQGNSWLSKNRATSIVNSVTLNCAVFAFVYISVEIPLVVAPVQKFCGVYHRIKIVSFALAITSSYFALWYRVFSMFYRNRVTRESMNKLMKIIIFLPLILLFLVLVSNFYVFLSAPVYKNIDCGCQAVQEKEINSVKWLLLVISTTTFQGTLLFSFIYPLYMHRKKMLNRGFDQQQIIPVVKRAAVVAVVCVVSDLINSAFEITYKGDTVYLNHIVLSLNLLVNLLGAILSFANWRKKLFPCQKQKRYFVKESKSEPNTFSQLNTIKIRKTEV